MEYFTDMKSICLALIARPSTRKESLVVARALWGASLCDARKILGCFDPLPPTPHHEMLYATKFTLPH